MRSSRALSTVTATVAWMTTVSVASPFACPICFGVEPGPISDGVRAAVFVLLGVTLGVLSGFGFFISRFVRRLAHESRLAEFDPATGPAIRSSGRPAVP